MGHWELSPLMSKALEIELNELMLKVNQVLTDEVTDPAEKIVVEKFKSNIGDSLRDTIGLNVTKRLLPVNNSLYVKMVFSTQPQRADLASFLKKYDMESFKRVSERGGTFIAKMKNFQTFDAVCTAKNLKCGNVPITTTPCYQFSHCPPNLKTIYDGAITSKAKEDPSQKSEEEIDKNQGIKAEDNEATVTSKNTSDTIDKAEDSNMNAKDAATKTNQNATSKETSQTSITAKTVNQTATPAKTVNQTATPAKTKQTATSAKTNQTATSAKTVNQTVTPAKSTSQTSTAATNQTKTTAKIDQTSTSVQTKQTATAAKTTSQTATPATTNQKSIAAKTSQTATIAKINQIATPAKTNQSATQAKTSQTATPVKKTNQTATAAKTTSQTATAAKTTSLTATATKTPSKPNENVQEKKEVAKVTPSKTNTQTAKPNAKPATNQVQKLKDVKTTKTPVKSNQGQKSAKNESDYDELDDRDILALLSEGIILDECSGSDGDY